MPDGTLLLSAGVVSQDPLSFRGTGSPETVVTAPVGSRFQRTDGGAGTTFYIKETGTGNTGWVTAGSGYVSKAGDTMTGDLTISRAALGAYLTLANNIGTTVLALDSAGNTVFNAAAQGFFDWSSYYIWRDKGNSTRNHLLLTGGASNDLALSSFGSRLSVGSAVTDVGSVLGVVGTAVTRITQMIRLFAGQTALALRIEDSASALVMSVDAAGGVACTSLAVGRAIIEGATTPSAAKDTLVWSTVHAAMMRFDGTQWQLTDTVMPLSDESGGAASIGGLTATALGAGTIAVATPTTRHMDARTWSSSTTAASGRSMAMGASSVTPGAGLRARFVFQTPATIQGTTSIRFGWVSAVTTAVVALTNGINLDVTGTAATLKTTAASTTTTSSSATLVASTWYTCHLIQTATASVRMILIADSGTVALDVTNTTNVPTAAVQGAVVSTNSGVTAVALLTADTLGFGWAL